MTENLNLSRRQILKQASALGALSASPLLASNAFASASSQRLLIMVYLKGGNDAYNTLVPLDDERYKQLRPKLAIDRDQTVALTATHGLRRELSSLLPLLERKELAIVQGIGFMNVNQQHYSDAETAFIGSDGNQFSDEGWVSRALKGRSFNAPFDAIALDDLDIRVQDGFGPFRGNTIRAINILQGQDFIAKHGKSGFKYELNGKASEKAIAQLAFAGSALKTSFPTDQFGQSIRAAIELALTHRQLPVIHVTLNSEDGDHHHAFDTHWDQLKYHGPTLTRLANGLSALEAGLKEIGRWNDTLVMTYDEFGRSPVENEKVGTHHGHASLQFLMGGKVKGGLHGEPLKVVKVGNQIGGPAPTIDYRQLFANITDQWWGLDGGTASKNVFGSRVKALDLIG